MFLLLLLPGTKSDLNNNSALNSLDNLTNMNASHLTSTKAILETNVSDYIIKKILS